MRIVLILSLVYFGFATTVAANSNAGIVNGLWFDRETIFAGETVRVYVAVRNNTGSDLSGTVEFFVNDRRIERKNIDALDGRIIESWADWKPSFGTSTVRATLTRTEIESTASGTQAVAVVSALAEQKLFIDRDTDGDGVGNSTDTDDDNDGISDSEDDEPLKVRETEETTETANATNETDEPDTTDGRTEDDRQATDPQGLEQFLTPSRADAIFTNITDAINDSKRRLDSYRETRSSGAVGTSDDAAEETQSVSSAASDIDNDSSEASSTPDIATNADGFGEVSRNQNEIKHPGGGWLTSIWNIITTIADTGYTLLLAILSFVLAYPSLLQVALLILILFIIVKVARRLARRPQS